MQEYVTDALVLDREETGEFDYRVTLFSKKYGKLRPKIKSGRKITSKLAGHLDVGNIASVRIIEKHGAHVVDALVYARLPLPPGELKCLEMLLADGDADFQLWHALQARRFEWPIILRLLGWDPQEARCVCCDEGDPRYFDVSAQEFLCSKCRALRVGQNGLRYIDLRS